MKDKLTIATAKEILRPLGIALRRKSETNEYVVNFVDRKMETGYFTDDLNDAVDTGKLMAIHRARNEAK